MKKQAPHEIRIKRVYDPPVPEDGRRFLIDRLWPRGVRKDSLPLAAWLPDAGPSTSLRKWFGHEAAKWDEFRKLYRAELRSHPTVWEPILAAIEEDNVCLLFAAKDLEINHAVVLKEFLEQQR